MRWGKKGGGAEGGRGERKAEGKEGRDEQER